MRKSWQKNSRGRRRGPKNRRKKDPFGRRAARFLKLSARVLMVVAAFPALGFVGWKVYDFTITTEHLAIKNIDVTGAVMVSPDEALKLLDIDPGENLFAFASDNAEENIKKNPWVESVTIRRKMPGTVKVVIKERTPVALVNTDELYVMDDKGTLFKRFTPAEELDLPVVTGLTDELLSSGDITGGLLGLLDVLSGRAGFNTRMVSEINVDPVYGFSLYTLDEGVRLSLGSGGFEEKLATFEKVVAARGGSLRGVEAMDLKNKKEVIVKFITNVVKRGGAA